MPECDHCDDCEILYDSKTHYPHWLREAKRERRSLEGIAIPWAAKKS